jgi:hypothetical protein
LNLIHLGKAYEMFLQSFQTVSYSPTCYQ